MLKMIRFWGIILLFNSVLFSENLCNLKELISSSLDVGQAHIINQETNEFYRFIDRNTELLMCFDHKYEVEITKVNEDAMYFKGLCSIKETPDAQINIIIKRYFNVSEIHSLIEIPISLSTSGNASVLERICPENIRTHLEVEETNAIARANDFFFRIKDTDKTKIARILQKSDSIQQIISEFSTAFKMNEAESTFALINFLRNEIYLLPSQRN